MRCPPSNVSGRVTVVDFHSARIRWEMTTGTAMAATMPSPMTDTTTTAAAMSAVTARERDGTGYAARAGWPGAPCGCP
jgi:hypothetical protein